MLKRTFFVHGWQGHPNEGFRPWLKNLLTEKGMVVDIPEMPDTNHPKCDQWVNYLSEAVGIPDTNTYFLGHSLGCITLLHYFEKINIKVGGCILVSGFAESLGKGFEELGSFFTSPVNYKHIKEACPKFIVIHSGDDPWVPIRFGKEMADKLNAEFIEVTGMRHFSGDDGISEAPVVLENFEKLIR